MLELIDVLSVYGLRSGEILPLAEIHRLGKYHRAVHVYIFNPQNELLIQKRASTVAYFPGYWGISVTGHVRAGEPSAAAARREIKEELGIEAAQLELDLLFSFFQEVVLNEAYLDRQFNDVYVTRLDLQTGQICFDRSEVSELKFVSLENFNGMVADTSSGLAPVYAHEARDLLYFLGTSR
jgi:isopentenyl-diphosphate delta-isomerase